MAYIGPKDFSQDHELIAEVMRVMSGDLDLSWMEDRPHPMTARPKQARRGLTLDDINDDPHYGPGALPVIIRNHFSMTPRGGVLPEGLHSQLKTLLPASSDQLCPGSYLLPSDDEHVLPEDYNRST